VRVKLLIAIGSIVFICAGLEVVTRLSHVQIAAATIRMQLDPVLGWRWTPNYTADEVYRDRTYHIQINALGLRNEAVTQPKPIGQPRLIALGDSITAGAGVNLDETFAKQLQHKLGVEVIEAGVDDYGTEQELLWLENDGLALEPTQVILEVYLNDSRSFTAPSPLVATLNNLLINRSMFYTYYYQQISQLRIQQTEQSADFRFRFIPDFEANKWKTDPQAFRQVIEEADQDFGLAWDRSENEKIQHSLQKLIDLSREHHFDLLVVAFPVSIQVLTEVQSPLVDQPQRGLADFAAARQLPYLDLLPILRAHAAEDLYIDQAHLTPHGHAIVADAIAAKLNLPTQ
jgi:lysophospholipase L1-like esterase